MVQPWWRFVPSSGSNDPLVQLRRRVNEIGRSVDWGRFDKYLRWLDPRGTYTDGYPPLILFRALLIQQWYALVAIELEHCLNDSISCRRFVGLRGDEPPPPHETVASFRRLLVERGMAVDIFAELDRQLETLGLKDLPALSLEEKHARAPQPGPEPPPMRVVQPLGPPEWTEIEDAFLAYWEAKRGDRRMPALPDVKLGEIPAIQSHAILLRVLRGSQDFRYEFVGEKIVAANAADPTGSTISDKTDYNLRNYGHRGLQSELAATYAGAVKRGRPVSTSSYFMNAGLQKCEIWVTVAPLASATQDQVEMLLGVSLIKPILLN